MKIKIQKIKQNDLDDLRLRISSHIKTITPHMLSSVENIFIDDYDARGTL